MTISVGKSFLQAPRSIPRRLHLAATSFVLLLAAIVLAPLISLAFIALEGDAEIWPHLVNYVLPQAIFDTALLLAGVALITLRPRAPA